MKEIDLAQLYSLVKKEAVGLEAEMHFLSGQMLASLNLRWFLKDQAVTKADKIKVVVELLPKASKHFKDLLSLLIEAGLINRLPVLAQQFSELVSRETGQQYLEIKSARALPALSKDKLVKEYGDKYRLRFLEDKNVIGGLRMKWEDGRYFDATVSGELEALKEALLV